jgi:hypothetical protein
LKFKEIQTELQLCLPNHWEVKNNWCSEPLQHKLPNNYITITRTLKNNYNTAYWKQYEFNQEGRTRDLFLDKISSVFNMPVIGIEVEQLRWNMCNEKKN